jgi:virginiamycin B lyase
VAVVVAGCLVWAAQAAADIGRANLNGSDANPSFITTGGDPAGVAVDGAHVYWGRAPDYPGDTGAIGRANLDGSGVQPSFITTSDPMYPEGVAVDGGHVYWGDYWGSIGRANLDGSGIEPTFIGPYVAGGDAGPAVAVDGGHVYWTGWQAIRGEPGRIGRANIDGSGVEDYFITTSPSIDGLAADGTHVYWTSYSAIGRANVDGSGVDHEFITTPGQLTAVAVNGAHVYWGRRSAGAIGRANLDGSRVDPNFITNARCVTGVAVAGGHIYWSNDGNCSDNTLTVRIKGHRVLVGALQYGPANVRLAIPAAEASAPCLGTLRLRTVKRLRYRGESRRLRLAKARVSLVPGTSWIRLRLSRSMLRVVRHRSRAHRVVAIVRLSDMAGNQTRATKRMTLRVVK